MAIPYTPNMEARADLIRELKIDDDYANEFTYEQLLEKFYENFSPKRVFNGEEPVKYTKNLLEDCYRSAGKTGKATEAPTNQNFAGLRELVLEDRLEN